jgi:transketolase
MKKLTQQIVELAYKNKEGHIGSSLSVLDILNVAYQYFIKEHQEPNRNRLILSKGHASLGLYVVLERYGLLQSDIGDFAKFDSDLGGHPSDKLFAVEASTGSLGHGLPLAVGMAMGYKIQNFEKRIYVIVGDGELNEGSNWEAFLVAAHHNLNNLTCIIDYNRSNDRALKLDNLVNKMSSFSWNCIEIDGHNHDDIKFGLTVADEIRPTCIIANTIKGHGISFMENNPEWHHKCPSEEDLVKILQELEDK